MTQTSEAADSRLTTCCQCCWGGSLLLSSKIHIKYLLSVGEVTSGEPEVILWPVRGPEDQVLCPSEVTWLWLRTRGNFRLSPLRRSLRCALKPADPDQMTCA
eukprot:3939369-Rhodomonas_salina.4